MIIICREVDKETGRITVYPIEKEVTNQLIQQLRLRSFLNVDLRYFATMRIRWAGVWHDEITALLKRRSVTSGDLERLGGIVEI